MFKCTQNHRSQTLRTRFAAGLHHSIPIESRSKFYCGHRRGDSAVVDREPVDPRLRAIERLIFGLRNIAGVEETEFANRSGYTTDSLCRTSIDSLIERQLLERHGATLRLTRKGILFADSVLLELYADADG